MKKLIGSFFVLICMAQAFSVPSVKTGNSEINRLTQLAMSEVQMNITKDGVFSAGAKWPTAWTRDMSYAIDLSLAFLFPEAVEKSLKSRVENNLILQDTGSGGSWPVSTDRITWAKAAYDYALFKQDKAYFEWVYTVIKNSIEQDLWVNFDEEKGLFRGETSFIDWREQSYPRWMDSVFIASSYALGTNNVYLSCMICAEKLAEITGKSEDEINLWKNRSQNLKAAINRTFWNEKRGYFSNYLISNVFEYIYEGYETLGNALCVLNEVNDKILSTEYKRPIISGPYGISVLAPQLGNVPSYHNDAVWPFVQGYYLLQCKKNLNSEELKAQFNTMITACNKFGTFKENYVASTFSPETQTNSDRQLWSDAGFLSAVYKILFGLNFTEKGLEIFPFVFDDFGELKLSGFTFNDSSLELTVSGIGDKIKAITVNGTAIENQTCLLPYERGKKYVVKIQMEKSNAFERSIENAEFCYNATEVSPQIPFVNSDTEGSKTTLSWRQKNENGFMVLKNFKPFKETKDRNLSVKPGKSLEIYSILSPAKNENVPLLPGTPVRVESSKNTWLLEAETAGVTGGEIKKSDDEPVQAKISWELDKTTSNYGSFVSKWGNAENDEIAFSFKAPKAGKYAIDFRFQNGHGPVNTGEKCALSALYVNGARKQAIPFPQQGSWTSWNFTSPVCVNLSKGENLITIKIDEHCYTQHHKLNYVNLDLCRISIVE